MTSSNDDLISYKEVMDALRKFSIRLKRDKDLERREVALAVVKGSMAVITHLKTFNCTMHSSACNQHD